VIFLLDSNAFSDLMRKNARIEARLAGLGPNDKVVICPIVRGEILYGIARLPTAGGARTSPARRHYCSPPSPASPSLTLRRTPMRRSSWRANDKVSLSTRTI
jgi:hypothetical protein